MISSFIGANLDFERKFLNGELELELVPQVTDFSSVKSNLNFENSPLSIKDKYNAVLVKFKERI
jgi:hypothetical protein